MRSEIDASEEQSLLGLLRRTFWSALIALAFLSGTVGALFLAGARSGRWVLHSRDVGRVGRQALALAIDRETGVRGYLLTGDSATLAPELAARAPLAAKLDSLASMTSDRPSQQRRVIAVRDALARWERGFAEPALMRRRRAGDPGGAVGTLAGKPLFDEVRRRFAEFIDVEDALYRDRIRWDDRIRWLTLVLVLGELAVLAFALTRFRRELVGQADSILRQRQQLQDQAVELELQMTEAQEMSAELERHTANAEALNVTLAAANRELEAFSYSLAHDLRAPLRSLDGYSHMLLDDYGATLDETARSYLERLRANSQRMGQLLDSMLGLARLGRSAIRRERVDLGAIARGIVDELRSAAPERMVDVRIADGLVVVGDPRLLASVLQNLLSNAWKFTAKRERGEIELGRCERAGETVYFVRDNGAGFDMAYAEKLFRPFERLHATDQFEGTGIGLATVQRVIQLHGGRVWAEAAEDRGATFYFTVRDFH